MMITKRSLARRTFLRGLGATVALPFLDSMVPALTALSKTAANPVRRIGCIYVPNGVIQSAWVPPTVGANFELTPILSPLEGLRDRLVIVSGLAHREADSKGDGNDEHSRGLAVWLSGVHAWDRKARPEISLGTTFDQYAALELGRSTALPSLELALESPNKIACDTGDCFYRNTISWRSPTTPNPMESHPRMVFERLFGDGGNAEQRLARIRKTGSILDSVTQEIVGLERTLGPRDRTTLEGYLEAVREVERRIQAVEQKGNRDLTLPERPTDVPDSFEEHAKTMFDLQVLAYQSDTTRVFTLMMAQEGSPRSYANIGVSEQHHTISHHRDNPELMAKKQKIDTYHVNLLRYFLDKLQSTPDGGGSLLDHSMILYGCGIGDGNLHEHTNLPVLLAGGGGGQLKGGRHVRAADATPMANLLLTLLDKLDVPAPTALGDSTGHLAGL